MNAAIGNASCMKYILMLGAAVFALLQIVPAPHRITHPALDKRLSITADPDVPGPVLKILSRSCMDCHSVETRVPWYGHVAPVSWLLAKDVTEARAALNLSEWETSKPAVRVSLAAAACAGAKTGRMPKPQYLLMHPEARLSGAEVDTLCQWQTAALKSMIQRKRAQGANASGATAPQVD